jgi:hypothetical protein
VLVCERVTRSAGSDPVLLAEYVFRGHLTQFVVGRPQSTGRWRPAACAW